MSLRTGTYPLIMRSSVSLVIAPGPRGQEAKEAQGHDDNHGI